MNLIWHIARKDLRRHRGWLALWALVLLAKVVLGWLTRAEVRVMPWAQLLTTTQALTWIDGVLSFLIAVLWLQEDRVAGSDPFWVTRPIAGARLLAAKLLGLTVALVGLPALVALPWWLTCGFGADDVAWAVGELFLWQLAIVLPAALVATLTDTFARAMLWTLVLVMAGASAVALWGFFVAGRPGPAGKDAAILRTESALVILAVVIGGTVVLQFLTRRTVRSLFGLGGGLALAVAALGVWPENWRVKRETTEVNASRAAGVTVAFESANVPAPVPGKIAFGTFWARASGVPSDSIIVGLLQDRHTWRWPDGLTLARDGWLESNYNYGDNSAFRTVLGLGEPRTDPETEARLDLRWKERVESSREARQRNGWAPLPLKRPKALPGRAEFISLRSTIWMPGSLAQRMRTDPPAYDAKAWLSLLRPVAWWEQSLQPGDWQGAHGHRMRITQSKAGRTYEMQTGDVRELQADWQNLVLVATEPKTLREDQADLSLMRNERMAFLQRASALCVINRTLGTLAGVRVDDLGSIRICSVKISIGRASIAVPKVRRGDQWVDWQPAWREGARLVMFGWEEEARFQREWKVDRMVVKP